MNLSKHLDRLVDVLENRPREDDVERIVGRGNSIGLGLDERKRVRVRQALPGPRRDHAALERAPIGRFYVVADDFLGVRLQHDAEIYDPVAAADVRDRRAVELYAVGCEEVDDLL